MVTIEPEVAGRHRAELGGHDQGRVELEPACSARSTVRTGWHGGVSREGKEAGVEGEGAPAGKL